MSKLQELIQKIKKVPFLKDRFFHDDSEDDSEDESVGEEPNKSASTNLDSESAENDNPDNDEANKKIKLKKLSDLSEAEQKRKKIIMLVVVGAIAIFLFGPEDEEENVVNKPNTQKVGQKKQPKMEKKSPAPTEKEDIAEKTNSKQFEVPDESTADQAVDVQAIKSPEKLSDLTNYEKKEVVEDRPNAFESLPNLQDENIEINEESSGEVAVQDSFENNEDPDKEILQKENFENLNELSEKVESDFSDEKIIKVDYDKLGRGLVYNCAQGFWACVNKDEYLNCRENLKWSNKLGNKKNCVPQDVYAGVKDCQIMQIHNINTSISLNFCQ